MAEYMGVTAKTVKAHVDESPAFWRDGNEVGMK